MEKFFGLILLSVVIEGTVTYLRTIVVDKNIHWQVLLAIALGVLVAIAYRLDLMCLFGLASSIPYLGNVLTGILVSRGSNYIFDLVKQLANKGVVE